MIQNFSENHSINKYHYDLLFSFYTIISKKLPRTHKKKKIINKDDNSYYVDEQGNILYYFFGYEIVDWIIKSKIDNITRIEAINIAQSLLSLFIISKYNLKNNNLISKNKLKFNDDRTCYSLIKYENIESYLNYINYLNSVYSRLKSDQNLNPNTLICVQIIFKYSCENNNYNNISSNNNSSSNISDNLNNTSTSSISSLSSTNSIEKININENINIKNEIDSKEIIEPKFQEIKFENSINLDYKNNEDLDFGSYNWTKYFQILVFMVIISTGGLASQWLLIHLSFNSPSFIYYSITIYFCILWFLAVSLYVYSFFKNYKNSKINFKNGVNATVYNIASLSFFQMADFANYVNRILGITIFWMSFGVYAFSMIYSYYHFIIRIKKKQSISITPSFLFTGGACIIIGSVAKHLDYVTIAWVTYGYGVIYSILAHISTSIEYFIRSRKGLFLPFELIPTQAIFIGYSSFSFSTYITIKQELTLFSRFLYLFSILNIIYVFISWGISIKKTPKSKLKLPPFNLGLWGFCFPSISFAVCTIFYFKYEPHIITKILAIFMIIVSNLVYLILSLCTIYVLLKRNLFIISKFNKSSFLSPKFNNTNININTNTNSIINNINEIKNDRL